jgi:hypothetical protein
MYLQLQAIRNCSDLRSNHITSVALHCSTINVHYINMTRSVSVKQENRFMSSAQIPVLTQTFKLVTYVHTLNSQ